MNHFYLILANVDLAQSLNNYSDRSKTLSGNFYVISVVVSIIVFWILLFYKDKIIKLVRPEKTPSEKLFDDLCTYHRLNKTEKKWLKELGELNRAEQSAMAFTSPEWFLKSNMPGGSSAFGSKMLKKLFGKDWTETSLLS